MKALEEEKRRDVVDLKHKLDAQDTVIEEPTGEMNKLKSRLKSTEG